MTQATPQRKRALRPEALLLIALVCLAAMATHAAEPTEIADFGSNPGHLRMLVIAPQDLPESPAVVVVLHGCGQTAHDHTSTTGWIDLAASQRFVLLLPETNRRNNPQACFRWFDRTQASRGSGEAHSIVQMIDQLQEDHSIDRARAFVTGFSAGGAMTAVMLATYPDCFSAGSIVAGVPFRCAKNAFMAMGCMNGLGANRTRSQWLDYVRGASSHAGP